MTKEGTYECEEVGSVRWVRKRGIRRVTIRVRPFDLPQVTLPQRMSSAAAFRLLHQRRIWIRRQLSRARVRENRRLALGPPTSDLDLTAGRIFLSRRLSELAVHHGFSYKSVTIRKQRSRWGSCSRDNRISLNLQLMVLPGRLRDYVLLHELLHTRIKHHGPEFWTEMERLKSDARCLRKELAEIALHPD